MPDDRRALGDPRLGLPDVNIVAAAHEFHLVAGRCHGTSNATRRTAAIAGLAGPSGRLWRGASRGLRSAHEESARRGQGLPWIHRRGRDQDCNSPANRAGIPEHRAAAAPTAAGAGWTVAGVALPPRGSFFPASVPPPARVSPQAPT